MTFDYKTLQNYIKFRAIPGSQANDGKLDITDAKITEFSRIGMTVKIKFL